MSSKAKVYSDIIDIQKKTGQGLSGLVKLDSEIKHFIEELLEEGAIVENDTGSTIGHPYSSIFYTPKDGYNVWEDENPMRSLTFVRFYLNILGDDEPFMTYKDIVKDPKIIKLYSDWLVKNKEALEVMTSLSDIYEGDDDTDYTETIEWIKGGDRYSRDISVRDFIWEINNDIDEYVNINSRLINLYRQRNDSNDKKNILEAEADLNTFKEVRKKAIRFLYSLEDKSKGIKEYIK